MDYLDEWRVDLLPEERLDYIYASWESWFNAEDEHLTIAVCLTCGNALQGIEFDAQGLQIFFCEVCEVIE